MTDKNGNWLGPRDYKHLVRTRPAMVVAARATGPAPQNVDIRMRLEVPPAIGRRLMAAVARGGK
jgi:hypothetical protein